jgi:hypothetical protein
MDKRFGDQLVTLWEEHSARGERDSFWMTNEAAFRLRLTDAAQQMFGDVAALLEWSVEPRFSGLLEARAEIPGYITRLAWSPDITGLYVFFARTANPGGSVTKYLVDGRLKLGAILFGEEPEGEFDELDVMTLLDGIQGH